jgi:copper amine oxidase-like protein
MHVDAYARALVAAAFSVAVVAAPAAAQSIGVTVSGKPVAMYPGPIERTGRVFVPLRGIFERLGATVVYNNGQINATGSDGTTIGLTIGSTAATVGGKGRTLDVAPFIVGASTYVPIRFVAESLGAQVQYDGSNNIVAIIPAGGSAPPPVHPVRPPPVVPPRPVPPPPSGMTLLTVQPARGATITGDRPTISATFSQRVDPNSLRVTLDGLNVTASTTRSHTGIVYAPSSPLQPVRHTVVVAGSDMAGSRFERSWTFTSGRAPVPSMTLKITQPQADVRVGQTFVISGVTRGRANVRLVATVDRGNASTLPAATWQGDAVAGAAGAFSKQATLLALSGRPIHITVVATDPATGDATQAKLTVRAR